MQAESALKGLKGYVLLLNADVPLLEPSGWIVHIEAESADGQPIVIDAKLDDIGSYNRTLTGTWKQAGVDHPFKMARE
jgi:bifunctional N-acetylglucosamine-1-phosphate-uridyltransferase/glucosamine-1-phosphate-acetyltransferase GlmU-like protein